MGIRFLEVNSERCLKNSVKVGMATKLGLQQVYGSALSKQSEYTHNCSDPCHERCSGLGCEKGVIGHCLSELSALLGRNHS